MTIRYEPHYDIEAITVAPDRMRKLNGAKVCEMAESITLNGLLKPLLIKPNGELIAGNHRLHACKLLEWFEVPVLISDLDPLQARLAEIDENLITSELSAYESGEHLNERELILEDMGLRRGAGALPGTNNREMKGEIISPFISTADLAAQIGLSERSAQQRKQIAKAIPRDRWGRLPLELQDNLTQLLELARMDDEQQETVVCRIERGEAKDVTSACKKVSALHMSETNEWYTPAQYIEAARAVMGGIDVDPASNTTAQETIRAATYYTQETDGLAHDWTGRVWLNPPYGVEGGKSNAGIWLERLISQYHSGITTEAIILVNAAMDRQWLTPVLQFPICFASQRIRFENPTKGASPHVLGSLFAYLGPNTDTFAEHFSAFGPIMVPYGGEHD